MKTETRTLRITSVIFGIILFTLGILNIIYVDWRPGAIYILVSMLYFPSAIGPVRIPFWIKLLLFLVIIWFTLGVSDLAEIAGL